MSKSTVSFEWQELREDQELPELPLGQPPDAAISTQLSASNPGRKRQRLVLIGGALCLLALALFGATWVERQAQAGLAEIESELVLAVDAEIWQAGNGQAREVAATAAAPLPASNLRNFAGIEVSHEKILAVEVQALRQDAAAVLVVTKARPDDYTADNDALLAYRQLRFYGRTENGWQPTEPIPDLWGQPQRLATKHFDITYRSRDAQAMEAVAAELDALYEGIRHNLGLSPTPDRKLTVEVVVGAVSSRVLRASPIHTITISSPALLRAPESLTDAVLLRQSMLLQLVDKGLEEAESTHWIPPRWYPMLSAMRLWQTWELGGPLAAGRMPVLRWLLVDIPTMPKDALSPLPAEYAALCALYGVWEIMPVQRGIPLFCSELDQAALYLALSTGHHPTRIQNLIPLSSSYYSYEISPYYRFGDLSYGQDRFDSVVTVALFDYVAATYGPRRIGLLWSILHEHKSWETLIPAVFGVSVEEFEADWQAYMAEQFQ